MPSRQWHEATSVTTSIFVYGITWLGIGMPASESLALSLGVLTGIPLTPDLDLRENKRHRSLWDWFWIPYAKFMPHRHPLSHWPILSTIIRLLYMVLLPALVLLAFDQWYKVTTLFQNYRNFVILWFIGLVISDTLHWAMDLISTAWKRRT